MHMYLLRERLRPVPWDVPEDVSKKYVKYVRTYKL